jgi:hypothetical protein
MLQISYLEGSGLFKSTGGIKCEMYLLSVLSERRLAGEKGIIVNT